MGLAPVTRANRRKRGREQAGTMASDPALSRRSEQASVLPLCDVGASGPRHPGGSANSGKGAGKKSGLPLSVAEVRRVIQVLREPEEQREPRLWWSHFRRQ